MDKDQKEFDYGTVLTMSKKGGAAFSDAEIDALMQALDTLLENGSYEDALGEPFVSVMDKTGGEGSVLQFRLSGHYFGNDEEENEDHLEFVEDVEMEEAQKIIVVLQPAFPELVFESRVEEW